MDERDTCNRFKFIWNNVYMVFGSIDTLLERNSPDEYARSISQIPGILDKMSSVRDRTFSEYIDSIPDMEKHYRVICRSVEELSMLEIEYSYLVDELTPLIESSRNFFKDSERMFSGLDSIRSEVMSLDEDIMLDGKYKQQYSDQISSLLRDVDYKKQYLSEHVDRMLPLVLSLNSLSPMISMYDDKILRYIDGMKTEKTRLTAILDSLHGLE